MAGLFSFLLVFGTCSFAYSQNGMRLDKVLILSRHNLRTPLTSNLRSLSTKLWPKWEESPAELTKKGALLESYLGDYFSDWISSKNLFSGNCSMEDIHVYANLRQRTIQTAKHFASSFRDCKITVKHASHKEDPIFFPVIHNTSLEFAEQVKLAMIDKLNAIDLSDSFKELYRITDTEHSEYCKSGCCPTLNGESDVVAQAGLEPDFTGALFIGNAMVDAFIMSYYNGNDADNIAWGEINTDSQWDLLAKILEANQDIRFRSKISAVDIAKPLLKYMKEMLDEHKLTALFGHDSNLNPVITALGFKSFTLPGQREISPIGGKLVFQKWKNETNNFVKVEYVYQTWEQIRNAEKLSLKHPPNNITMYFSDITESGNGFYPWGEFVQKLEYLTRQ